MPPPPPPLPTPDPMSLRLRSVLRASGFSPQDFFAERAHIMALLAPQNHSLPPALPPRTLQSASASCSMPHLPPVPPRVPPRPLLDVVAERNAVVRSRYRSRSRSRCPPPPPLRSVPRHPPRIPPGVSPSPVPPRPLASRGGVQRSLSSINPPSKPCLASIPRRAASADPIPGRALSPSKTSRPSDPRLKVAGQPQLGSVRLGDDHPHLHPHPSSGPSPHTPRRCPHRPPALPSPRRITCAHQAFSNAIQHLSKPCISALHPSAHTAALLTHSPPKKPRTLQATHHQQSSHHPLNLPPVIPPLNWSPTPHVPNNFNPPRSMSPPSPSWSSQQLRPHLHEPHSATPWPPPPLSRPSSPSFSSSSSSSSSSPSSLHSHPRPTGRDLVHRQEPAGSVAPVAPSAGPSLIAPKVVTDHRPAPQRASQSNHSQCDPVALVSHTQVHHCPRPHPAPVVHSSYEKPTYSYAALIGQAIMWSPEQKLCLNDIYAFISHCYPYYRKDDAGWQNSIRHNLSLNESFIKLPRGPNEPGKGSFWAIAPGAEEQFANGGFKKCLGDSNRRGRATQRRRPCRSMPTDDKMETGSTHSQPNPPSGTSWPPRSSHPVTFAGLSNGCGNRRLGGALGGTGASQRRRPLDADLNQQPPLPSPSRISWSHGHHLPVAGRDAPPGKPPVFNSQPLCRLPSLPCSLELGIGQSSHVVNRDYSATCDSSLTPVAGAEDVRDGATSGGTDEKGLKRKGTSDTDDEQSNSKLPRIHQTTVSGGSSVTDQPAVSNNLSLLLTSPPITNGGVMLGDGWTEAKKRMKKVGKACLGQGQDAKAAPKGSDSHDELLDDDEGSQGRTGINQLERAGGPTEYRLPRLPSMVASHDRTRPIVPIDSPLDWRRERGGHSPGRFRMREKRDSLGWGGGDVSESELDDIENLTLAPLRNEGAPLPHTPVNATSSTKGGADEKSRHSGLKLTSITDILTTPSSAISASSLLTTPYRNDHSNYSVLKPIRSASSCRLQLAPSTRKSRSITSPTLSLPPPPFPTTMGLRRGNASGCGVEPLDQIESERGAKEWAGKPAASKDASVGSQRKKRLPWFGTPAGRFVNSSSPRSDAEPWDNDDPSACHDRHQALDSNHEHSGLECGIVEGLERINRRFRRREVIENGWDGDFVDHD